MKYFALALLCLIHHVRAHSWIACADYMEKNGAYWDPNKCRGFPRDAARFASKNSFGLDTGFDYKPSNGQLGCKTRYSSSSYSSEYPKSIYYPGQQVILTHPMKNHGADKCTNQYIPDNANKIYRGQRNRDRDQNFGYYRRVLVADLGVSPTGYQASDIYTIYPKPGYQNAPKFCEDTDKSMGTYAFNVPTDLNAGEYTFVWRWSFNGDQDIYATCFDVIIAQNKAERDNVLRDRGFGLYVACGGVTSDGSTPGNSVGCDDSGVPPPPPRPETTVRTITTRRPAVRTTTPARRTTRPTRRTTRPTRRPTTPTRRPRPQTTNRPTTTTRAPTTPVPERKAYIYASQISGFLELDQSENGISVRYVSVLFPCQVEASFWNARTLGVDNRKYDLVQEGESNINNKIYFTATFRESCDIISNPIRAYILVED